MPAASTTTPRSTTAREHPTKRPLRRWRRRVLVVLALLVALFAIALAFEIADTSYSSQPLAFISGPQGHPVPGWTAPCQRKRVQRYVLPCARVTGRVIYVQKHDPDGDDDRHVLVVADLHLVTVKISGGMPVSMLPHFGDSFEAAGLLSKGRLGFPKINYHYTGGGTR